jgi:uncharacterized protein (UPF0332 family)/predicted nucleotidyltransferase
MVLKKVKKSRKRVKKKSSNGNEKRTVHKKLKLKVERGVKTRAVSEEKTLSLVRERDMAMDFASKVYREFDALIKSIVLFGSSTKVNVEDKHDVDIIIILDDISVKFDDELISWYRKHLAVLIDNNKYIKPLHVNSVKLSTWWQDLMRGDPIVVNVLRYGDALIDFGGFFNPLKIMLKEGRIKSTPEAIYTLLERAPTHLARARRATLAAVDGLYWSMVDSAHAALISADVMPPSPEKIGEFLEEYFVKEKLLNRKYVDYYKEIHAVAKEIVHGKKNEVSGQNLDDWFYKADDFLREMAKLVEDIIRERK